MVASTSVRYEPRGGARELFKARDSEVLLEGPAGTGKSLAALFKLHLACLKTPGVRALIVRKTATSLTSTTLVTLNKKVIKEAVKRGLVSWYGGSAQEAAAYRYSNGSTIVVGGMDKPERVLSSEYDLIFADEATELTITDWETLGTRLRNGAISFQQQIAACNPGPPTHWLKQRANAGITRSICCQHADNPAYVNADGSLTAAGAAYLAKLDALTGVRLLRLRKGIWAAAEGLVYEDWNPAVHLIDGFQPPPHWRRIWTVDFGFVNPFVCQMWAIDDDGRMHLYKEIYRTRTLVEDHAKMLLSIMDVPPDRIICDHDAEDRATLERHLDMPTIAASKSVSDGIQACSSRLRVQGDGKPRVFFHRDAATRKDPELVSSGKPTCTAEEITSYAWPVGSGKIVKEAPVKLDDHGMDAWRYCVMELDMGRKPRYRSFSF